jgi:hypothetical protein
MERQIVDIEYEDGSQHIGQIYKDLGNNFSVNFLGYAGDGLWDFDGDYDLVPRESISGFYDATRLQDTGLYEITKNGYYVEVDSSDDEYVLPSDSDSDSDSGSDVSLEDEF